MNRAAGAAVKDLASFPNFAESAPYVPHFTHSPDRIWPETNCYLDLWIEVLHGLGYDPVPAFACTLSADHDGLQWSFVKPLPEDLRRLYGLEVAEENVWMPLLETMESGPARNILHTVEVDSWWLPDTSGSAYRTEHVKTTIVPTRIDRRGASMRYIHNAGLHELSGDDFAGVFGLTDASPLGLPPYVEQVRWFPDRVEDGAVVAIAREHLARRPRSNPVDRLIIGLRKAAEWLPAAGMAAFHRWAFATLRQCGAGAELAADFAVRLDAHCPGAAEATPDLRHVAAMAKSVQFKMARLANGRRVDVDGALHEMAWGWQRGLDRLAAAVA